MKIAVWGLGNHAINKILPALKEISILSYMEYIREIMM